MPKVSSARVEQAGRGLRHGFGSASGRARRLPALLGGLGHRLAAARVPARLLAGLPFGAPRLRTIAVASLPPASVAEPAAPVLSHDELPLPDYDHLTLGSLRSRLRGLSAPDLADVLAYERAHADRVPIVTMFENRLRKLAAAQQMRDAADPDQS